MAKKRNICFVTGTRAEFGLMRTTLNAIAAHPRLNLQIIATGMHLSAAHGSSLREIRKQWKIDALVSWPAGKTPSANAIATGNAIAQLARKFEQLKSDIIFVVGDRVEPFAAASAAHIANIPIAHVHGGDRALGQIDDSLRHAITKLAHIHFPATRQSAARLVKLGEDNWRIHRVGSPGIDGIRAEAADIREKFPQLRRHQFALLVLHPADADDALEDHRATQIVRAITKAGLPQTVIVYPNNDPGHQGIIRAYSALSTQHPALLLPNIARPLFLGLLRDAAFLIGNSSAGIIEAPSFNTPVIDIGPRQAGRERCENVTTVPYAPASVVQAISRVWNDGDVRRQTVRNIYGGTGTGRKIADILGTAPLDDRLLRKLISY